MIGNTTMILIKVQSTHKGVYVFKGQKYHRFYF